MAEETVENGGQQTTVHTTKPDGDGDNDDDLQEFDDFLSAMPASNTIMTSASIGDDLLGEFDDFQEPAKAAASSTGDEDLGGGGGGGRSPFDADLADLGLMTTTSASEEKKIEESNRRTDSKGISDADQPVPQPQMTAANSLIPNVSSDNDPFASLFPDENAQTETTPVQESSTQTTEVVSNAPFGALENHAMLENNLSNTTKSALSPTSLSAEDAFAGLETTTTETEQPSSTEDGDQGLKPAQTHEISNNQPGDEAGDDAPLDAFAGLMDAPQQTVQPEHPTANTFAPLQSPPNSDDPFADLPATPTLTPTAASIAEVSTADPFAGTDNTVAEPVTKTTPAKTETLDPFRMPNGDKETTASVAGAGVAAVDPSAALDNAPKTLGNGDDLGNMAGPEHSQTTVDPIVGSSNGPAPSTQTFNSNSILTENGKQLSQHDKLEETAFVSAENMESGDRIEPTETVSTPDMTQWQASDGAENGSSDDLGAFGTAPTAQTSTTNSQLNALRSTETLMPDEAQGGFGEFGSATVNGHTDQQQSKTLLGHGVNGHQGQPMVINGDTESFAEKETGGITVSDTIDLFGDFGESSVTANPSTLATNEMSTTTTAAVSHDFGDFAEGTSTTPAPLRETTTVLTGQSDDFGDFGGFDGGIDTTAAASSAPKPTLEDSDDFGGFGSFSEAPTIGTDGFDDNGVPSTNRDVGFGDFGVGAGPALAEKAPHVPITNGSGDFAEGMIDNVTASAAIERNAASSPSCVDDSGAFGSFQNETTTSGLATPSPASGLAGLKNSTKEENNTDQVVTSRIGDGVGAIGGGSGMATTLGKDVGVPAMTDSAAFGNFGDFHEGTAGSLASFGKNFSESVPAAADANDDFGDFGETTASPDISGPTPASTQATEDAKTDDFGDFEGDAAPDFSEPGPTPAQATTDDFSDFGKGSAVSDVSVPRPATTDGDDAFGNFGDFEDTAPTPALVDKDVSAPASADSDDDFGDFGDFDEGAAATPASVEEGVSKPALAAGDADDDFGDFGESTEAASTKAEEDVPKSALATTDSDDDFGDFGDFDEGVAATPASVEEGVSESAPAPTGDDFGDFDTSAGGDEGDATYADPYVQQVSPIFERVFGQFSMTERTNPASCAKEESVKVTDVLNELSQNQQPRKIRATGGLESLLSDASVTMVKRSDGKVISGCEVADPFSKFSYPFNEADVTDTSAEILIPRQAPSISEELVSLASSEHHQDLWDESPSSPRKSRLDILNAKAESGHSEFGTTSHSRADREDFFGNFSGERSAFDSGEQTKGLSAAAALFMKKIPDLSFMLGSQLSVPR